MFGCTSKKLEFFLRAFVRNLWFSYEHNTRDHIIHALATNGPNKLQQCILGVSYVQIVVHALNDHFVDFQNSMQPNFSTIVIIQANDSDQITNTKLWLERIMLKFQSTEEEYDMCKENYDLWKHFDMSVRANRYLRLGAYVVAFWNGTRIGMHLCNFGKKLCSFHQI